MSYLMIGLPVPVYSVRAIPMP